jgi:hypothetical protein
MEMPTGITESIFYLTELFNMAVVPSFEDMLGQTINHCVELCNFLQCIPL